MNAVTREEWMHALLALQRGRMCWCEHETGNPMMTRHSPQCEYIRALFMGESKGGGRREVVRSNVVSPVESTGLTQPQK